MSECIIYIHGRGGSSEEAEHFRKVCDGVEVIGLDYHSENPWENKSGILAEYESMRKKFDRVSVIANSIGAYFCMNALSSREISRAFFISPVVDMERMITGMMSSAGVSEAELKARQKIDTSFGEKLSWKYLQYVRDNQVNWTAPTYILYGEKDALIPFEAVREFAQAHNAELTVMPGGEHWFHTDEQMRFLDDWFRKCINIKEE